MRPTFRHVAPLLLAAAGLTLLISSSGETSPAAVVDSEQYPYRAIVPNIAKSDGTFNPPTPTATTPAGVSFFQVSFIDVGQGDATLIVAGGQRLLVDGGRIDDLAYDRLLQLGYPDIDAIVATHSDADHIGGLIGVLEEMEVERIYLNGDTNDSQTYDSFIDAVNAEGATVTTVTRGMSINLGGLVIEVVHPPSLTGDLNEDSVVLTWQCGEVGVTLMGDATIASETAMISAGVAYDIDVLKLGHHGSNTSTSQAFLDATTPSYAVVSAGRESQFGHPHQGVVDRVLAAGATLYHTDTTTGNDTIVMGSDCETVEFYADPWTPGGVPSATPTATTPASTSTPTATATTGACGGATAEITALDKGGETVSVTGTGNMTGWYLISESGSQRFDFPNGFTLNGTVTIYSGTTQFPNTPTSLWWSGSNFWNNSSDDDAFLYNCTGGLVDVFEDGD